MFKNRIIKAISEAVYNVLSTDIIDQDIDFDNNDIDNEYVAIDKLTEDFLTNPYKDTLDSIVALYNRTQYQYKVQTFEGLEQLIRAIFKSVENSKNIVKDYLHWIDMSAVINIITSTGNAISVNNYSKEKNAARFLRITDPKLVNGQYDNTIYVYIGTEKNHEYAEPWYYSALGKRFNDSQCVNTVDGAWNDFNGWMHTYRNVNIYKDGKNDFSSYPIFNHLNTVFEPGYDSYVPAYGQLYMLYRCYLLGILDYIGDKLGYKIFACIGAKDIWSSTECVFSKAKSNLAKALETLQLQIKYDYAKENRAMYKKAKAWVIPFFMPENKIPY